MCFQVVNVVWNGYLEEKSSLQDLTTVLSPKLKVHLHQSHPRHLNVKIGKSTFLIYPTMRFLLLGSPHEAMMNLSKLADACHLQVKKCEISTISIVSQLDIVKTFASLQDLCEAYSFIHYEPELFPACYFRIQPNIHVNIFTSGKMCIFGVREYNIIETVLCTIRNMFVV